MKCSDCRLEGILLPLAINDVFEGPSRERSLRLVMELEVSERESSMPRGRAGAIAQLKSDVLGWRCHCTISRPATFTRLGRSWKQKKGVRRRTMR